jgi:streptogramin lyase
MKTLNAIAALVLAGTLFGCGKKNSDIVKPANTGANSYVADQVTIYSGVSTNGAGSVVNGTLAQARYSYPNGIIIDKSGNLYVSEYFANDIRKITPDGTVSTYASGISHPGYLAMDTLGNLYVPTDYYLAKVAPNGVVINGALDAKVTCLVNNNGTLFAATANQVFMQNAAGEFALLAGNGAAGSADAKMGDEATFNSIVSMAADPSGNLFVMDYGNGIRVINPATTEVKTFPLKTTQTPFGYPQAMAVDQWDNIYVVNDGDNDNNGNPNYGNGYIIKITPDGTVTNFAGNRLLANNVLEGPAQSVELDAPNGIVLLPSGDFLVTSIDDIILKITTHKQQ